MCCFSGAVESVSDTRIFARPAGGARQLLVYSMTAAARQDLAMILPLPVPPSPGEDAVRFIDLQGYPRFFEDLAAGFAPPVMRGGPPLEALASLSADVLQVHQVGDFEASFVPTLADFRRLDPRFRLPDEVWAQVPGYADFGFAVFKLRYDAAPAPPAPPPRSLWDRLLGRGVPPAAAPRSSTPGGKTIHPMAFEFPRRDPARLFFPTVHVHDGAVHRAARFDHALYAQPGPSGAPDLARFGQVSDGPAAAFMDVPRAAGVIDGALPCYRQVLEGDLPNRDTYFG